MDIELMQCRRIMGEAAKDLKKASLATGVQALAKGLNDAARKIKDANDILRELFKPQAGQ